MNPPVAAPPRGLAAVTGLPLSAYRRDHVQASVARAMRREHVSDLTALATLADADPDVRTRLRRQIAVSTTGLFRDPTQLRWLDANVLSPLTVGSHGIRAWSAGCAGGEEAFTLATMLEWHGVLDRSEVVGSDILDESLADAEAGLVGGARIPAGLRGRARWDQRDLTSDGPPEGRFELILCRNLLTFLTPVAAEAVGRTLAVALAPGGVVMVARDERLDDPEALGLERIAPEAYRRLR